MKNDKNIIIANPEELERKNIRTIHHDIDAAVSYLKKNGYKKPTVVKNFT